VRFLVVGLGSIGRRHLVNLRHLIPDANITVWRHAPLAGGGDVPREADGVVTSLDEALSPRPDMAILASPAPYHVRTAAALASAGVHILVEKPLSDSLDGVDALIDACGRRGIVLMVGYHLRFDPSLTILHDAVADGIIGRLLSLRSEVGQYLPEWRPGTDYRQGVTAQRDLGGGVVLELSHELDYVRWVAGEVRSVRAETGRLGDLDTDVEDVAEILLRFIDGSIGSVHLDMIQRSPTRTCRIIGTEGTLEVRSTISVGSADAKPALFLTTRSSPPEQVDASDVDTAWAPQLVADIKEGVNRLMPHSETFAALRAVLEMQKKAERIGPQDVTG